ncbi:MAG: hypothetical protein ACRCSK_05895, partial [Fusobacteriaceae bacterium]
MRQTQNKIFLIFLFAVILGCSNNLAKNNSFENNEKYTLLRGMNLSQEGKYLEAIRELNLARARNPENIMVLR